MTSSRVGTGARRRLSGAAPGIVLIGIVVGVIGLLAAQSPPNTRGTMALEGTMKTFYKAANTIIVTTIDGVDHAYHFTKDLLIHGGKSPGPDALADLREGTTVVVHYETSAQGQAAVEIDEVGGEGLKITEGVVTRIDHRRSEITIRFDNGKTETLKLTLRAAAEAGKAVDESGSTRIIVYYSDEGGRKVAHYFKRA